MNEGLGFHGNLSLKELGQTDPPLFKLINNLKESRSQSEEGAQKDCSLQRNAHMFQAGVDRTGNEDSWSHKRLDGGQSPILPQPPRTATEA